MNAHAMSVELALFHHDSLLCRTTIRVENHQKSEEIDCGSSAHFVVRHQFGLPAASLYFWLVRLATPERADEIVLEAAVQMGVHDSDDWESIALGKDYTLAFLCQQHADEPQ